MRRALLVLALALAACGGGAAAPEAVRVDGLSVRIDADAPPRGVQLELAWDDALHVRGISAGADAARLDLVRVKLSDDGRSARAIVADTRRVPLPAHGELLHVDADGDGAVRLVRAQLVAP